MDEAVGGDGEDDTIPLLKIEYTPIGDLSADRLQGNVASPYGLHAEAINKRQENRRILSLPPRE